MSDKVKFEDKRLQEDTFLSLLAETLNRQQMDTEIYEGEGNMPASLDSVFEMDGEEKYMTALFLPLGFLTGDAVQMFQLYFPLWEEIPEEDFARAEELCNYCNGNVSVGTFLLQRKQRTLAYKQGLALRGTYDIEPALNQVLDNVILMIGMIDGFYPGIKGAKKGMTLTEILEQKLIPDNRC